MGKFVELFKGQLTRDQVKIFIYKLVNDKYLEFEGISSGREYFISKNAKDEETLIKRAIEIGREAMKRNGEISTLDVPTNKRK